MSVWEEYIESADWDTMDTEQRKQLLNEYHPARDIVMGRMIWLREQGIQDSTGAFLTVQGTNAHNTQKRLCGARSGLYGCVCWKYQMDPVMAAKITKKGPVIRKSDDRRRIDWIT